MNSWEHVTLGALSPGFSRHKTHMYGICTREFKETRRVVFPLCIHSILSDESLPWQKCSPTQLRPLHAYKNGDQQPGVGGSQESYHGEGESRGQVYLNCSSTKISLID